MNYEDLTPEQKAIWDDGYNTGVDAEDNSDAWDIAWEQGYEAALLDMSQEPDSEGIKE